MNDRNKRKESPNRNVRHLRISRFKSTYHQREVTLPEEVSHRLTSVRFYEQLVILENLIDETLHVVRN